MVFLPIVARELRIWSRRKTTYWQRSLLSAGALVIWFFLLVASRSGMRPAERAQMLFAALGVLCFAFCLLSGVFITADAVSEEKREGTIGLLFLTDLKGYDVIIGKLAATSLHAIYGLLAVLPLLALPLLMGGVSKAEFLRVTLALLTTLFFSLSLGMVISTFSREARQAMACTVLLLLLVTAIFPTIAAFAVWASRRSSHWDTFYWFSPAYLFAQGFDANFSRQNFNRSFFLLFALALGCFGLASAYLPSLWQEKGLGNSGRNGKSRGARSPWRFGTEEWRARRKNLLRVGPWESFIQTPLGSPLARMNPFYWLATRDRLPQVLAWGAVGGVFCIWLGFFAGTFTRDRDEFCQAFSFFSAYFMHQVLKFLVACEACRRISDDRHSGALELLLVSPLRVEQILEGQRAALRDIFRGPILLVLTANFCQFLRILGWAFASPRSGGMDHEIVAFFILTVIGGAVMLGLDFYALSWIGMSRALLSKRYHWAVLGTIGRLVAVPWLSAFLVYLFLMSDVLRGEPGEMTGLLVLWLGAGAVVDLILAVRARRRLEAQFRQLAALGPAKRFSLQEAEHR
ncbi:MAG: hypothetical protein C5B50_24285 [Verrucomicrobia bacterium]|nr:MAG: hypothetical protein C5B50_24285 [Verrucomicrobiota bacterium]